MDNRAIDDKLQEVFLSRFILLLAILHILFSSNN